MQCQRYGYVSPVPAKTNGILTPSRCRDYQLSNYFPAKTLAAACIYTVLRDRDLLFGADVKTWLREKISRTVYIEDFQEAVTRLEKQ